MLLTIGARRSDALADEKFVTRVMRDTADVTIDRDQAGRGALTVARAVLARPQHWWGFVKHTLAKFWHARHEWPRSSQNLVLHSQLYGCLRY